MKHLKALPYKIKYALNRPHTIFLCCVCVFVLSVLFNGTLWRLWSLNGDHQRFVADIEQVKEDISHIEAQMKIVKDPSYIKRLARDKMDLIGENDLMFVFTN